MSSNPSATTSLPTSNYFSILAGNYARTTGNTTATIFSSVLKSHIQPKHAITNASLVHNNAAGPGTAASILLSSGTHPKELLVSDIDATMISNAREGLSGEQGVECKELDSHDLSSLPEGYYTHSITNFSIFVFHTPSLAMGQIHRTLAPGGLAVVTTWKRFPMTVVVRRAQALVRPDLPPMPSPGEQFLNEGVLKQALVEGGFAEDKIAVVSEELVIKEGSEEIGGLRGFLLGPFMKRARNGWTEDEEERWPEVVEEAIKEEVERFGGIKFEAWVAMATK